MLVVEVEIGVGLVKIGMMMKALGLVTRNRNWVVLGMVKVTKTKPIPKSKPGRIKRKEIREESELETDSG